MKKTSLGLWLHEGFSLVWPIWAPNVWEENERKKERVGELKVTAKDAFKERKALSFWGLFFYCCPLWTRLLGLLHNAGPLRAAHHWLSCHFTLVSLWRTAAPEGPDTLVMKEVFWTHMHTHIHTEWVDIRRCWGHYGQNGSTRRTSIKASNRTITVTLFQLQLHFLPATHQPKYTERETHFSDTHSKNMFS